MTNFHYFAWDNSSKLTDMNLVFDKPNLKYYQSVTQHLWPVTVWILPIILFRTNAAQSVAAQSVHQLKTLSAIMCYRAWRGGDNSVEKLLFSKTILSHSTTPYLGYFLCILLVRFLMREHLSRASKVEQTRKANFILREQLPIFKLLPSLLRFITFRVCYCAVHCCPIGWTKPYSLSNIIFLKIFIFPLRQTQQIQTFKKVFRE